MDGSKRVAILKSSDQLELVGTAQEKFHVGNRYPQQYTSIPEFPWQLCLSQVTNKDTYFESCICVTAFSAAVRVQRSRVARATKHPCTHGAASSCMELTKFLFLTLTQMRLAHHGDLGARISYACKILFVAEKSFLLESPRVNFTRGLHACPCGCSQ